MKQVVNNDESSNFSILIVEDNNFPVEKIETIFRKIGCVVDKKSHGQEALDSINNLERAPYNLIFLDLSVPSMDLLEIHRQYTAMLPVALTTALIIIIDEHKQSELNVYPCIMGAIQSPITTEKLFPYVKQINTTIAQQLLNIATK